jgi:tetratricopeptide (TPR) repeat protein
MEGKWVFNFTRYKVPNGAVFMTLHQAERALLAELDDNSRQKQEVRSELIAVYREQGDIAMAEHLTTEFMEEASNKEERSWAWLKFGQIREQVYDFDGAVGCYSEILDLLPESQILRYFAHNNIGYSLNQLGRYAEAEEYCRKAIAIDPSRYNAHKNLGVSLENQGLLTDAVACYITSIRSDAADPRAMKHLEDTVMRHRELLSVIPDLTYQLHKCRQAVMYARCVNEAQS